MAIVMTILHRASLSWDEPLLGPLKARGTHGVQHPVASRGTTIACSTIQEESHP